MSSGGALGAFSAVLGYLGGQAATDALVERFFWPQRYMSSYRPQSLPKMATMYSLAGPLSQVALDVMDKAHESGLLTRGKAQGNMLGTHFFSDLGYSGKALSLDGQIEREMQVRNCVWVRALLGVPLPDITDSKGYESATRDAEGGHAVRHEKNQPLRARAAVCHLVLSKPSPADKADRTISLVSEHSGQPHPKALLGIVVCELSGIGLGIAVSAIWRTLWALLFFIPVLLRLLGGLCAVHREPLAHLSDSVHAEVHRRWEISTPAESSRFILISGPPTVVNQFFRHYGHPIRNRFREMMQLVLIVAFGIYFPVALLFASLNMPVKIQYAWNIWEVYLVVAMHVDRYTLRGTWSSGTETRIAQHFACQSKGRLDKREWESTILFGEHRRGDELVKATCTTRIVDSVKDGQDTVKGLIQAYARLHSTS